MKNRAKGKHNRGFTVVETLATVAIIVILLAVSSVPVVKYVHTLKLMELDNAARDIYMAAENRTVLLSGARQLNTLVMDFKAGSTKPEECTNYVEELQCKLAPHTGEKNYYVSKADLEDTTQKKGLLLTIGSIDETLRDGDFYIVYDLVSGSVTDVFYAKDDMRSLMTGGFDGFYKTWTAGNDWAENRNNRLNLRDQMLVGWYNGKAAEGDNSSRPDTSENPYIEVDIKNEERLTVTVKVKGEYAQYIKDNPSDLKVKLGPIDDDFDSKSIELKLPNSPNLTNGSFIHTWTLDSLDQDSSGTYTNQFKNLKDASGKEVQVTPGDDFKVVATITRDGKTFAADDVDNSLFWKGDPEDIDYKENTNGATAHIKYLRHLQNLSADAFGYNSGVPTEGNKIKTEAIQISTILGDDNATYSSASNPYKFIPINNPVLESYTVKEKIAGKKDYYEIRNLTLNVAGNKPSVGLFARTEDVMELNNIRMVNTKVSAAGAGFVGALAGKTFGSTTITNCWVYWDEVSKLTGGPGSPVNGTTNTDKYQLEGNVVGGLVGEANGTTKIINSLAATLIRGTDGGNSSVGGLVGMWNDDSDTVDITHCYADCYLTGTGKVAGLVGEVAPDHTVSLKECYAAGFIMGAGKTEDKEQAAGLSMGTGATTADHVYSVMLRAETDATTKKTTYKVPEYPLTAGSLTDEGETHFMGGGEVSTANNKKIQGTPYATMSTQKETTNETDFADTMGTDAFEWKNTADKNDSHPYNLQYDPSVQDSKKLEKYVYPGLVGLPHYDDWGELSASIEPIGLVYFEQYTDDTEEKPSWGFSAGYETYQHDKKNDMEDLPKMSLAAENLGKVVKYDGYGWAFWASSFEDCANTAVNYTYQGKVDKVEGSDTSLVTGTGIKRDDGQELFIFALPVQDNEKMSAVTSQFYTSLEIKVDGDETTKTTVYFNPHFADTIVKENPGSNFPEKKMELPVDAPAGADPFDEFIEIRSARHLYNLGALYANTTYYGSDRKYNQLLDVDYTSYVGYKQNANDTWILTQKGIGRYSGGTISFGGTYNAGVYDGGRVKGDYKKNYKENHTISGLNINDSVNGLGLFGNVSGGSIYYVTVESGTVNGTGSPNLYIGGIVGYNDGGAVYGCVNKATVKGTGTNSQFIGGIVGYNNYALNTTGGESGVHYCWNAGPVEGNYQNVGGVAGRNNGNKDGPGIIEYSRNTGSVTVSGSNERNVGGVVGENPSGLVQICYNTGAVKGKQYVGGVAGNNTSGTIKNSYNTGPVGKDDGTSTYVGGVVGNVGANVTNCYNIGTVKGSGNYVGAVVGYSGSENDQKTCYYLEKCVTKDNGRSYVDGSTQEIIRRFGSAIPYNEFNNRDKEYADVTSNNRNRNSEKNFDGWAFEGNDAVWVMAANMPIMVQPGGTITYVKRPVLLENLELCEAQSMNNTWSFGFEDWEPALTKVEDLQVMLPSGITKRDFVWQFQDNKLDITLISPSKFNSEQNIVLSVTVTIGGREYRMPLILKYGPPVVLTAAGAEPEATPAPPPDETEIPGPEESEPDNKAPDSGEEPDPKEQPQP